MPKITFTESQRLDILDCLPDEKSREAYWADLEYHSRLSPVWEGMRVGNKKPFAKDVSDKIDALEEVAVSLEISLADLTKAHLDDGYAPFPMEEAQEEIEKIKEAIGRLFSLHMRNTPYTMADGREKRLEKTLVNTVLGLWCRHFPDHPLPKDPRQGRARRWNGSKWVRPKHEESPALRLCGIVLEAATGKSQKDLRRLYVEVLKEWDTSGTPLFSPRQWCEMMDERIRKTFQHFSQNPTSE